MILETLIVSDYAKATDGLLTIVGGGWEYYRVDDFPVTIPGWVSLVARMTRAEAVAGEKQLTLRFTDREGLLEPTIVGISVIPAPPGVPNAMSVKATLTAPFSISVSEPTIMNLDVHHLGEHLGSSAFAIGAKLIPQTEPGR